MIKMIMICTKLRLVPSFSHALWRQKTTAIDGTEALARADGDAMVETATDTGGEAGNWLRPMVEVVNQICLLATLTFRT